MNFKIGDKVFIKYNNGMKPLHTPLWCVGWTGTIVRLNKSSVTVEFEVNEPDKKFLCRYIDYEDIQLIEES